MFKKILSFILLACVLLLSMTSCNLSVNDATTDEAVSELNNISNEFKSLFDKALDKTGFNINDVVSVSYQSPEYVKYYSTTAVKYMGSEYSALADDVDSHVLSFGTYYGKAATVVFNLDGDVVNVKNVGYDSIDEEYKPKHVALDALNTAVGYLGIDCSDICILQMVISSTTWCISIATSDAESDSGFSWYDDVIIDTNTGDIISLDNIF